MRGSSLGEYSLLGGVLGEGERSFGMERVRANGLVRTEEGEMGMFADVMEWVRKRKEMLFDGWMMEWKGERLRS
jgi:hypothetical protein